MFVTSIGPKLRTQRPRKTEIDTEVAHVTFDPVWYGILEFNVPLDTV